MTSRAIYGPEEARGWRPWGILVPFLALAFVAVAIVGLTLALQRARLIDADGTPIGLAGLAAFLLLPFSALALVVTAWTRFVERRPLASIGLVGRKRARTFVFGVLTGIAMTIAIVAGGWLAGAYSAGAIATAFHSTSAIAAIALLLGCFAVQSSAEEILFRGWMLSAIAAKFGTVAAISISSLAFMLLHFEPHADWLFAANVFLFAVFASCWSIGTGNIWGVMGWHAGWNWLLAVGFEMRVTGLDAHVPALLVKMTPGGSHDLTGGFEGPEGSVMCSLLLLVGLAFLGLRRTRTA
ncbi:MAG: type II CAAX endopeptidase family protein [Rhizomicrobium sp.]|jgi:membrane protease YdiL (CAAX protease family)